MWLQSWIQQSLLQSSVSDDPSEIIQIILVLKKNILINTEGTNFSGFFDE